jgi:fatty acid desaturase
MAFVGDEFKDDFRKALPKDLVQQLTQRSAWRATSAILHDVAVLAAAIGAALYFWPNPLVIVAAVIVIGTRQHALFVIAHEAAHYLLFQNRKVNDFAGRACATVQGLSMCTYRVIHRLHHNNLYGELDPDTALHGAMVKHGLLENAEVVPFRATLAKIFAERAPRTPAAAETARTARAA